MLTAVAGVAAFILVIVMLVLVLMGARAKLVNSADVRIVINGDESNPIVTPAGGTLLNTLAAQKIFIPSACGGGGTCRYGRNLVHGPCGCLWLRATSTWRGSP